MNRKAMGLVFEAKEHTSVRIWESQTGNWSIIICELRGSVPGYPSKFIVNTIVGEQFDSFNEAVVAAVEPRLRLAESILNAFSSYERPAK